MLLIIVISIFLKSCKVNTEEKMIFSKCMNIGNALEAPKGEDWGVKINNNYFDIIKNAGFDSVRIPVRFSDYAKNSPDYSLDEGFMKELDSYINYALKDKLVVILDFHHFIEIMEEPDKYKDCFISVWRQLSNRYKNYPQELIFELLNEPKDNLKGETWNELIKAGIEVIRENDKSRKVIIGPDNYYSVDRLEALTIPKDNNIIISFHYYEPNDFTFQGNKYHLGFENLKDIKWEGTKEERDYLKARFNIAKQWAASNKVEVFLGEFGANQNTPAEDRKRWTEAVRRTAEDYGFSFGYWELCSWFGIYDVNENIWNEDMLEALLSK